jgi:hypothetical protein
MQVVSRAFDREGEQERWQGDDFEREHLTQLLRR